MSIPLTLTTNTAWRTASPHRVIFFRPTSAIYLLVDPIGAYKESVQMSHPHPPSTDLHACDQN